MKKNFIVIFLVVMITALICGFAAAQAPAAETIVSEAKDPGNVIETRVVPVIRNNGQPDGTVQLRFYEDMPHVAYISAADYLAMWIPGALISDMYSNYFGILHSGFNGEKVVMNYSLYDWMLSNIDKSYSEGLLKQISPQRAEDLAVFTYKELCFVMDRLYGHPGHETLYGREAIHATIAEKGLDKALTEDFGETGRLIKEYLTSTNPAEYFVGTYLLYLLYYDGHTLNIDAKRSDTVKIYG